MTLRARLVVSFTVLLLIAIAAVGAIAMTSTRSVLIDQIDTALIEVDTRLAALPGRGLGNEYIREFVRSAGLDPRGQESYRLVRFPNEDPDNIFVFDRYESQDDVPNVAQYDVVDPPTPQTISAIGSAIEYRAIGRFVEPDNRIDYFAVPLTEVDDAIQGLLNRLLLAGSIVLLIGAAITWWTVRHDMRPVEDMIDTAAAIGGGDLSQRVPPAPENTEIARLGDALNHMLTHIEHSFESEQEAQHRLKQFIADASHELRTPITSVKGYAELYRAGGLADEEALANAMARIEKESARMGRLVEDLLLLARLDRESSLERGAVDMKLIVDEAVSDFETLEPDRPIHVSGDDSAFVQGDEARLTQVVANLLNNARIHTPPGSPVDVTVRSDNGHVVLEVTDDGPGIPPSELTKVFDRFHRVDTSRARKSGGSGLGLSIVSAIVESHGGTVAASNANGRGAQFTVTLPSKAPISGSQS